MEIVKTLCFVIVIVSYVAFDTGCASDNGSGLNTTTLNLTSQVTSASANVNKTATIKSKAFGNTSTPGNLTATSVLPTTLNRTNANISEVALNRTNANISEVALNRTNANISEVVILLTPHNVTIPAANTKPNNTVPDGNATARTSLNTTMNNGTTLGKSNKHPAPGQTSANQTLNDTSAKGDDTVTPSTTKQNLATPAAETASPGGIVAGVILGMAALFILICVVRRRLRTNRRDDAMRRRLFNNPIRFEEDSTL